MLHRYQLQKHSDSERSEIHGGTADVAAVMLQVSGISSPANS